MAHRVSHIAIIREVSGYRVFMGTIRPGVNGPVMSVTEGAWGNPPKHRRCYGNAPGAFVDVIIGKYYSQPGWYRDTDLLWPDAQLREWCEKNGYTLVDWQ